MNDVGVFQAGRLSKIRTSIFVEMRGGAGGNDLHSKSCLNVDPDGWGW
jgi:hypothetical protein